MFFFFQAEDGIRDLVRSRGLGDVYKRQRLFRPLADLAHEGYYTPSDLMHDAAWLMAHATGPVSYTHLTLPTSDLV